MGFLDSVKSKMGSAPAAQPQFGDGERAPLPKQMSDGIRHHMSGLRNADLSAYTFERRKSTYTSARSDLVIYDAASKAVLHGREDKDGKLSIWSM